MTPIQKLVNQHRIANTLAGNSLTEARRNMGVNGRLASAEVTENLIGQISHFAGMNFLESIHEEIKASTPVILIDNDPNDDRFDNSPYRPAARFIALDMTGKDSDETDDSITPPSTPKRRGRPPGAKNKPKASVN